VSTADIARFCQETHASNAGINAKKLAVDPNANSDSNPTDPNLTNHTSPNSHAKISDLSTADVHSLHYVRS